MHDVNFKPKSEVKIFEEKMELVEMRISLKEFDNYIALSVYVVRYIFYLQIYNS